MKVANPSFYRLFQRSRYNSGPVLDDDCAEAEAAHEERERFSAAGLAFCLKHDADFRRSFLEKVCRVHGDPVELPEVPDTGVELEPIRWADLRLSCEGPNGRHVWVIELKAGASLQDIQNPCLPAFAKPKEGYGWHFERSEPGRNIQCRYIVLGAREKLGESFQHPSLRMTIRQSHWSQVAACKVSTLVDDLFLLLGQFHIEPFAMRKIQSVSITKGLSGAGNANEVLMSLYDWFGVKGRQKGKMEVYADGERGGTVAGIYVHAPNAEATPRQAALTKVTGRDGLQLWIGYFANENDTITRSVYFYSKRASERDRLLAKLKKTYSSASWRTEGPLYCVIVEGAASDSPKDYDWFTGVLEAAGVKE